MSVQRGKTADVDTRGDIPLSDNLLSPGRNLVEYEQTLRLTVEQAGDGICAVSVSGPVDIYTAPRLEACLGAQIDHGVDRLIVDLSQATCVDSSALGVLVDSLQRVSPAGRLVAVVDNPLIRKTFEITRLRRLIPLPRTRAAAITVLMDPDQLRASLDSPV